MAVHVPITSQDSDALGAERSAPGQKAVGSANDEPVPSWGRGVVRRSQQQAAPPDPRPPRVRAGVFAAPLAVALLIVTTSPVMRQVRDFLLESLGARFAGVLAIGLGVTIGAAIIGAALRIREPRQARRWLRFGGLGLALALLGIQIFGFGTGDPLIDAVEHFHLIEYGLLGALFYRTFRGYRDGSALPLTVLAVTLVGIVDELVQWWTPIRVGDARDVVLNAYAGLCGMLFGLSLAPPERWVLRGGYVAARRVGRAAALTCLAFAFFYDRAHLGYEVTDPEVGQFRDWHSREGLLELQEKRASQWAAEPPTGLEIAGPEDFYLTAAMRHVAYRDESLAQGDSVPRLEGEPHRRDLLHALSRAALVRRHPGPEPAGTRATAGARRQAPAAGSGALREPGVGRDRGRSPRCLLDGRACRRDGAHCLAGGDPPATSWQGPVTACPRRALPFGRAFSEGVAAGW